MEYDFDKEIDTLLRQAHRDGPVYVGDFASPHLDADEISAFAENAMPEKSRTLYTAHLADCDRCRKILSNLLVMNAEAAPAAASPSVITIAERSIPWYRQLLLFPNLAYVMGSLVLVFAGFMGYTIIQNSTGGESAMVSQAPESRSVENGPSFQGYSESANSAGANAAANTATSGAFVANTNSSRPLMPLGEEKGPAERGADNFALDGVSSSDAAAPTPAAPANQPAPKDLRAGDRDDVAKSKLEDKVATGAPIQEAAKESNNLGLMQQKGLPNVSGPSAKQSGPKNRNETQYNRQLENMDARARTLAKKDEESSSGRRVVSGKTFERKEGVWYDTTYQGRPTINVRRGTAEFNRLDGGLRSIANSFTGTIVVVWGAKAYRIQ